MADIIEITVQETALGVEVTVGSGLDGADGAPGADGKSAYEVWIDLGNVGTEADFIDSLVGTGDPGPQGSSAYEVWLAAGNSGTEQDFIDSLTGPQGPPPDLEGTGLELSEIGQELNPAVIETALGYVPQEPLVSGTNIKTIGGESVLGMGNISLPEPEAITEQSILDALGYTPANEIETSANETKLAKTIDAIGLNVVQLNDYTIEKSGTDIIFTATAKGGSGKYTFTIGAESNTTGVFTFTVDGVYEIHITDDTESSETTETINVRALSWSAQMADDYIATNNQCPWSNTQRDLIIDRLEETYVVDTFGPTGLNKTVCDFFIFIECQSTQGALINAGRIVTKTGDTIRWNYGDGNIYNQNLLPAEINNGVITLTSTDGWGGLTNLTINNNFFINNLSGLRYATNITTIDVRNNRFTHIQTHVEWTAIQYLYVSDNYISKIKTYIEWVAFRRLYIQDNRCEDVLLETNNTSFEQFRSTNNNLLFVNKFNSGHSRAVICALSNNKLKYSHFRSNSNRWISILYDGNNLTPDAIADIFTELKRIYVDTYEAAFNNLTINLTGGGNAYYDYASDANYIALNNQFTASGKTLTVDVNPVEYIPEPIVYFSYPKVIQDLPLKEDRCFLGVAIVQTKERIHCFFREGRSHQSYDGTIHYTYSDNLGETWSESVEVYSGDHILEENPDILTSEPRSKTDVRDPRIIKSSDGSLLLFGFVSIGYNSAPEDTDPADPENIDIRNTSAGARSVCIKIPYDENGMINPENKSVSIIHTGRAFSGGAIQKNGVTLASTYAGGDQKVYLHRSDDLGITWHEESEILDGTNESNETALQFTSDDILYCVSRSTSTNGFLLRSFDYGKSWQDITSVPARLDGLSSILLSDGRILWFGRRFIAGSPMQFYISDGLTFTDAYTIARRIYGGDGGYGNVIEIDGELYFSYSDGPRKPYPNLYEHGNCGLFFVKADKSTIEGLSL